MANPLDKMQVTSPFGPRTPVKTSTGWSSSNHAGVDLRGNVGDQVYAAAAGQVVKVGNSPTGWGIYVDIKTPDGYTTRYAHLSSAQVKVGDTVAAGAKIAKVGATGSVTGAHLHFGVYDTAMTAMEPLSWLSSLGQTNVRVPSATNTGSGYSVTVPELDQQKAGMLMAAAGVALALGVVFADA